MGARIGVMRLSTTGVSAGIIYRQTDANLFNYTLGLRPALASIVDVLHYEVAVRAASYSHT